MNISNSRQPVNVQDSDLSGSRFCNANLAGASFDNVNLQKATVNNVNLSEVSFHNVNLSNVRISDANTTGMSINGISVAELLRASHDHARSCEHEASPSVFTEVMPVLRVSDMQRAIDWYTQLAGFALEWRSANDGGGENCLLRAGPATLMLSTGTHLGGTPVFTGTLYFNMRGVGAFHDRIRDKVQFVWPLERMDYGTLEFGIRDPDGYTLAFAERVR